MRWNKRWQTPILALICFVAFVVAAVLVFDVPTQQLWQHFVHACLLIAVIVGTALLAALLLRFFKRHR